MPLSHRLPSMQPAMRTRIEEARGLAGRGTYEAAEDALLRVLGVAQPDDVEARFEAWHYLASVYGMLGRVYEAHLCSKTACAIAEGGGDAVALALALPARAAAADALGCHADVAATLAALDGALEQAGDEAPPWAWQDYYEARAKYALHQCKPRVAQLHLDAMCDAMRARPDVSALDLSTAAALRARIALREERPQDALDALAASPAIPDSCFAQVHALAQTRAEALAAAGRSAEAHVEATAMLMRLEAQQERPELASIRIEIATDLSRFWDRTPHTPTHSLRVRNVLASAILERIAQVDAWTIRIGDRAPIEAEQTLDLVALRRAFEEDQQEALRAVAEWLPKHLSATDVLVDQDDGMAHLCAWCMRLRSALSHKWLPLGHYVPRDPPFLVSHGVCDTCLREMRAKAVQDS